MNLGLRMFFLLLLQKEIVLRNIYKLVIKLFVYGRFNFNTYR